jgi:hypothetical protein
MIIWILNSVVDRSEFGNKALKEDEEGWKPTLVEVGAEIRMFIIPSWYPS